MPAGAASRLLTLSLAMRMRNAAVAGVVPKFEIAPQKGQV